DLRLNAYVFERRVDIRHPDGNVTKGYIDLYYRQHFVLEAKQTGQALNTPGWSQALLAAHHQADRYVRNLPTEEGRPPFIILTDVGRVIELYAEFTGSGGIYTPFPDPSHHRIRLEDLRDPVIQQRLRQVWLDPLSLDPSRYAARVTREISATLANLARSLEGQGYAVERVAGFLMQCLFTMFAEDVELLPADGFTRLLERLQAQPALFVDAVSALWRNMDAGGYDGQLMAKVKRFNGGLFHHIDPLPLTAAQIGELLAAARQDWRFVEPAIFGTLLERALDPRERHKLGAHYTPRAYVERLVMPTVIEPLRRDWSSVQIAAAAWVRQNQLNSALAEVQTFHHRLCHLRILDPACGSGNFLYVTLEHLKRLEGEVLNLIRELSGGQEALDTGGLTVDPHQFLGLERNPRAAAIAEMVLWIGYLQWHYRIHQRLDLPEPILRDFHNIEGRDALMAFDGCEPQVDSQGQPVTRWDGVSFKTSPITGELIPDENQRIPQEHYVNPRPAVWPAADYVVGNPPFIGASAMRRTLGDGYVDAVRATWPTVPESADFVMYWWHIAAEAVGQGTLQRFGFITTNSIRQTFNRRVLSTHLDSSPPLSLTFAISDHPWVDTSDGAAVRIAMTVAELGDREGVLQTVRRESEGDENARSVELTTRCGKLHADLTIGANVAGVGTLAANAGLGFRGITLMGSGFWVEPNDPLITLEPDAIKPLRNGKDLTSRPRGVYAIDFFGLSHDQAWNQFPAAFQRVLDGVKPERDQSQRAAYREKWWIFAEARPDLRAAKLGLPRYIATAMTAKHRVFTFLESAILPDQGLIAITLDQGFWLGLLSSRLHIVWALANGGTLESRPRYNNSRCFETFPFPDASAESAAHIRDLAEQLDAHRKRQQAQHPELTLTGMYNVLEILRTGEPLNAKDLAIHQQGLVSLLRELHDDLDRAVFIAYGWSDLAEVLVGQPGATTPLPDKPAAQQDAEEELLRRLVDLNTQRAEEEAQGQIRWLRPAYQNPNAAIEQRPAHQESLTDLETRVITEPVAKRPWPKAMCDQVDIIRELLTAGPRTVDQLAAHFQRKPVKVVLAVLETLEVMNLAHREHDRWRLG
ncbi:MAG: hypothetical protein QG599_1013, partial [Pseudomonadota bacterium]|nr:hypothetical protein [Pseudomonadota bacterium]